MFNDKSKLYLIVNFRFQWLLKFLDYLKTWKEACNNRPSNFDQNARSKMFISWQTHEGFQLTVYSVIEATQFLLQEGMDFVLTERICQDAPEEYFGHQRKLGRQNDNPDIQAFGYNNNAIRIQRQVSCQSGNTQGRKDRTRAWEQVTDDPIPCKKKVIRHCTIVKLLHYYYYYYCYVLNC